MSKNERLSARCSFGTVCDAARRLGYKLKMTTYGMVAVVGGWHTYAVISPDAVADWLQSKADEIAANRKEVQNG